MPTWTERTQTHNTWGKYSKPRQPWSGLAKRTWGSLISETWDRLQSQVQYTPRTKTPTTWTKES